MRNVLLLPNNERNYLWKKNFCYHLRFGSSSCVMFAKKIYTVLQPLPQFTVSKGRMSVFTHSQKRTNNIFVVITKRQSSVSNIQETAKLIWFLVEKAPWGYKYIFKEYFNYPNTHTPPTWRAMGRGLMRKTSANPPILIDKKGKTWLNRKKN